ncbi:Glycerophosphoryl diester phosphodiesterase family protein [Histomonas meleagridis]|uniref:Glycerophosphoryl diester phosphodiesterase family protein n=1 Tax=Histomonas meleagridis TaxID=135588 RepID=UPI003559C7F2|nr:Glycerophosphoryl diester phosphodiesterase family protein [Histomonas meleagridis]KAH0801919.1 Glycerophosphoryl diester phosphodiesterase family protein [Histomonas meleagridis]
MFYCIVREASRIGNFTITEGNYGVLKVVTGTPTLTGYATSNSQSNFIFKIPTTEGDIEFESTKALYSVVTLPVGKSNSTITLVVTVILPYNKEFFNQPIEVEFKKNFSIGHRGKGSNLVEDSYQENTITGFLEAHKEHVDFVEFDVQLTSENTPVIHHDFYISYNEIKEDLGEPINNNPDGSHNYAIMQFNDVKFRDSKLHLKWNETLPTLKDMMTKLPKDLKFDIEIKYPFLPKFNGFVPYKERNAFIDRILDEIHECKEDRALFFSSFDVECIAMLCVKQKRWPVFQLMTREEGESIERFTRKVLQIAPMWKEFGVKGFVLDSSKLLLVPELVDKLKSMGYIIMTYGSPNNTVDGVVKQLDLGVQGICTDKLELLQKTLNDYNKTTQN